MAERMEAERRSEQEMQIARQVQSRLLPQQAPVASRHSTAPARCIQTRAVGGDYYDFLDFGAGSWAGAGRYFRQRDVGGAADGEPAGQSAWPICAGD